MQDIVTLTERDNEDVMKMKFNCHCFLDIIKI